MGIQSMVKALSVFLSPSPRLDFESGTKCSRRKRPSNKKKTRPRFLERTNNSEKYVTQLFRKTSLTSFSFKKTIFCAISHATIYSLKNVKKTSEACLFIPTSNLVFIG